MNPNDLLVAIDGTTAGLRRELSAGDAAVAKFGSRVESSLRQIDGTMRRVDGSFKALDRGSTGFNRFSGAAQQAGYQIGDFAVQVASGQNAVVALTQQMSQLLGAFGTAGAVIGAGAAIAGAIATKFVDVRGAAEKFEDGLKGLNDQMKVSNDLLAETETGLTNVGNAFLQADTFGRQLIRSNLEENIRKQSQAIRDQADAIKELTAEQELFATINGPGGRPSTETGIFQPAEGMNSDQAFRMSEAMRAFEESDGGLQSARAFAQALIDMRAELDGASPAFTEFADQLVEAIQHSIKAGEVTENLKDQLATLGQEAPKNAAAIQVLDKAFEESVAAMERARSKALALAEAYDPMLAAKNAAYARVIELRDAAMSGAIGWDTYQAAVARVREEFQRSQDPLGAVQEGLKAELAMLKLSDEARKRAVRVQTAYTEAVKNGAPAVDATRKAIEADVDAIIEQERANTRAAEAQSKATQAADAAAREQENLAKSRRDGLADLESERAYLADLEEAHRIGAAAIFEVETARKAELIIQRLKLDNLPVEAAAIRQVVEEIERHKKAIDQITEADKKSEEASREKTREQERAAKEVADAYRKTFERISDFSEQALGDSFYDLLRGETVDFAEFLETTLIRAIANVAAAAATQTIVMPIATTVVGAVPGLFGLPAMGGAANQNSPGGIGDIFNLASSAVNKGGLIGSIVNSSFGASLGLSKLVGPAAGVTQLVGPMSGLTAFTRAQEAALIAGGWSGFGPTSAGSLLMGATPYLGLAAAALPLILGMTGAFSGPPSVGPTGVGRFHDPFDYDAAVFSTDNDGSSQAVEAVGKEITGILGSLRDSMGFRDNGYAFDIGYFPNPEGGSGREAGFTFKEIINGIAGDKNLFEGLEADELVLEAVRATLQRGIENVDSEQVASAIQKSTAETIEEFLSDLDFAKELGDYVENGLVAPLNPVEQAFEDLADRFDAAKKKATELGLSVADVTAWFGDLNQQMVDQVQADLTSQLRDAQGNGFLNTLQGLLEQRDVNGANAAAAGLDIGIVGQIFSERIGPVLTQLTRQQLGLIVENFDDAALVGAAQDVIAAMDSVAVATTSFADAQARASARMVAFSNITSALDSSLSTSAGSILAGLGIGSGSRPVLSGRINSTLDSLTGYAASDIAAIQSLYDQIIDGHKAVTEQQLDTIISAVTEEARAKADLHRQTMDQLAEQQREMADFARGTGSTISSYLASLRVANDNGATYQDRLASAREAFTGQLSVIATSQNEAAVRAALSGITDYAERYRSLLREGEASGTDYRSGLQFIETALETLPMVQSETDRIVEAINAQPDILAQAIAFEFSGLDINGDLALSLDELTSALGSQASESTLQAVLGSLDANGDGQISALEAVASNTGVSGPLAKQQALTAFYENLWGPANNSYLKQLLEALTEQDAVSAGRVFGSASSDQLSDTALSGAAGTNNVSRARAVDMYNGGDWQGYFGQSNIRGYVQSNTAGFLTDMETLFAQALDWSESRYLSLNPDVAPSVTGGAFTSGLQHYLLHGIFEGRKFEHGGMVTGGIPGVDSVPILAQQGERVFSVSHSAMLERLSANVTNDNSGIERRLDAILAENRALREQNTKLLSRLIQVNEDEAEDIAGMRDDNQRRQPPLGRRQTLKAG